MSRAFSACLPSKAVGWQKSIVTASSPRRAIASAQPRIRSWSRMNPGTISTSGPASAPSGWYTV
jgi:hypothetical protein